MTDRELAQLTFAFRIFDHEIDISYSTREKMSFRDNMMSLGVTSMSAGSKTEPGGYVSSPDALEQFTITDARTPHDVVASISAHGYEPVWKDWDAVFDTVE
jgi:2-iminoacetate synthase